ALALGAQVKVFDSSRDRLSGLQTIIGRLVVAAVIQPIVMKKAIISSDVVIGAIRSSNGRCPCLIDESTVEKMKPNSVLIDVSIDQGGCFETSQITNHLKPTFRKHDVIHYCVPNIASRVARTATYALTNIFTPILLEIGERGSIMNLIWNRPGVRNAVYLYQGALTNKDIGERFNMTPKDLELIAFSQR